MLAFQPNWGNARLACCMTHLRYSREICSLKANWESKKTKTGGVQRKFGNSMLQSWAWALKNLLQGLFFFCIFEKSGIKEATDLAVSQLLGPTIAIISAHVPGQHMWASVGPGPSSSSPKLWKTDGRVKIYNSLSARSPLTKSKKKKIKESTAIWKRTCQCTDGLSATHNGRGAAESFCTR